MSSCVCMSCSWWNHCPVITSRALSTFILVLFFFCFLAASFCQLERVSPSHRLVDSFSLVLQSSTKSNSFQMFSLNPSVENLYRAFIVFRSSDGLASHWRCPLLFFVFWLTDVFRLTKTTSWKNGLKTCHFLEGIFSERLSSGWRWSSNQTKWWASFSWLFLVVVYLFNFADFSRKAKDD